MKIIDILVKIANGEALPEKIKFENHIYYAYHYENKVIDYYYIDELKNQITLFEDSMRNYGITSYLNDEVEILEDTNEITAEQIMMATDTLNRLKPTIIEATINWNKVAETIKNNFSTLKDTPKEEKKIPEKIKIEQDTPSSNYYIRNENGTKCGLTKHSKMIVETLNQVIDYLKSKGDE